ncbi:E3 ubiquitin-protein ligase listerin-like [Watersipora subatra]|uniref:E3 ubiquitin-protein ligase listerin-like n=1 Tax=Watersipora subatra TaxID=2589382 RepID=UPI00355B3D3F
MGGKKKEAHRTKGNLKPASSGHAAQLLEATGELRTGFRGFESLSGGLGYVPVSTQAADNTECGDGELRMVMKRLTKRDAVTKLKALQNFNEICQERESDVLTEALKYWPRIYSKLAIDYDHRVREAAHNALKEVASRSGRNLAPYLKQLIGAWMLSFCDGHAPAASAARSAFQSVFNSETKSTEAVVYCHAEIIKYLYDMLFNASPETLSDSKTTSPEEMKEKYERALSASFLCLSLIISMCPQSKIKDFSAKFASTLEQPAFWKYSNHSNRMVKSSFFNLLSRVMQDIPALANDYAKKICSAVLSRLGETDPVICPNLWEAVGRATSMEHYWSHVNVQKAMLPGLWSILKKGFDGNAATAAPKLLDLFKSLPPEVSQSHKTIVLFFSNLQEGLLLDKVQRSAKELNSLLSAYHSCLSHVMRSSIEDDLGIAESLLDEHLFPLLRISLTCDSQCLSRSSLYREFASFVIQLTVDIRDTTSERVRDCYSCLKDMCWERLRSLSDECVAAEKTFTINRFVLLLKAMVLTDGRGCSSYGKDKRVGFEVKTRAPSKVSPTTEYSISRPDHRLYHAHPELKLTIDLVASVCCLCLDKEKATLAIHHAVELCQLCGSIEFYNTLGELLGGAGPAHIVDQCRELLSKSPYDWLDIVKLVIVISEWMPADQMTLTLVKLSQALPWTNMYGLLSIVHSVDWLTESMDAWLSHKEFNEHIGSMKAALIEAIKERDITTIRSGLDLFMLLVNVLDTDCEEFLVVCTEIQQSVIENLSSGTDVDLFELYCECISALVHSGLPLDHQVLVTDLFSWLTNISNTHAGPVTEMARDLLQQVLAKDERLLSHLISCIKHSLESFDLSLNEFTLISSISKQLSMCSSPSFADAFSAEISCSFDESDLFKFLAIPVMKGQLPFITGIDYITYDRTHLQSASIPYVNFLLFISTNLVTTQTDVESISFTLHKQFAAVHAWLSFVLEGDNSNSLISSQSLSNLELWLSNQQKNKATYVEIFNSGGSESMLDCLAVHSLISRLPDDTTPLLSSQATSYMFSFSTLSQPQFVCLSCISQQMHSWESRELMELVGACVISTDPGVASPHQAALTGLLQIFTNLLARMEEADVTYHIHVFAVLDFITDMKSCSPHQFVCEQYPYLAKVDSDRLMLNVTLMRLYVWVIKKCPSALSGKHWDLMLCMLDRWIGEDHCVLSSDISSYDSHVYISNVTLLLSAVGHLMKNDVTRQPSNYPSDFLSEWAELHAQSIYTILLPYFVQLAESIGKKPTTVHEAFVLGCLSNSLTHCPPACVKNHKLEIKLVPDSHPELPRSQETALNHLVPLLLSPYSSVQSACFLLINHLVSALPAFDKEELSDDKEGRSPPSALMSMLDLCGPELLSLVGGARIGVDKPIELLADSEELCCVRAFLLTWKLLLKYLQYSSTQQMAEYSFYLKQNSYTADLLLILFNIIPLEERLPNDGAFMFNSQLYSAGVDDAEPVVVGIACWIYYNLIRVLPAVVRSWYKGVEKRTNVLLDRFTAKYVSPRLCKDEMEEVQTNTALSCAENLTVKVRSASREILATYTLEEFSIELLIVLPSNYPVGVASVECSKKLGVAANEWRKWMLQLNTFLTYQNGSVANAINLWKRNLDKKFEGVEECYICFSVLHGSNLQLPKQQCKTCKKKFHSACLYKWFTSSQKSTCPLCRNLF